MNNLEYYRQQIRDDIEILMKEDGYQYELALGMALSCLKGIDINRADVLDWLLEEHNKEPILNDKEREYLSNIVKPFKNKVIYIKKAPYDNLECIIIFTEQYIGSQYICLPMFKSGAMYRNMGRDIEYTVRELEL